MTRDEGARLRAALYHARHISIDSDAELEACHHSFLAGWDQASTHHEISAVFASSISLQAHNEVVAELVVGLRTAQRALDEALQIIRTRLPDVDYDERIRVVKDLGVLIAKHDEDIPF